MGVETRSDKWLKAYCLVAQRVSAETLRTENANEEG